MDGWVLGSKFNFLSNSDRLYIVVIQYDIHVVWKFIKW